MILGRVFVDAPLSLGFSADHYPMTLSLPRGYYEVLGEFRDGRLQVIRLERIV